MFSPISLGNSLYPLKPYSICNLAKLPDKIKSINPHFLSPKYFNYD